MEWAFYSVALIMIGFATYQIYKIRASGKLTEEAWQTIRVIAYEIIDKLMRLYTVKTDKEAFIDFVINQIKEAIDNNEYLTQVDRDFWTKDKLIAIFRPVLNSLIEKFEELKK